MKRIILLHILLSVALSASSGNHPKNKKLVAKGGTVTRAGTGYAFTEGPAVAPDGSVYFTDQPNNKIDVWHENGSITNYTMESERSNGTYFSRNGELVICADLHNRLAAISPDKKIRVLAENYQGNHLNGPNDLWIAPNGGIYFSDPYYQRPYWEPGHTEIQDVRGVYYLSPDGKLSRVISDYKQPNGLIGTPDGKTLYVSDINDRKIWKYTIGQDGALGDKTFFAPEGSDGMTIDREGNVYLTNKTVSVYNAKGENIARIEVPEQPSNLCFAGRKKNILFITARTSVYILKMRIRGY